jgi:hypothetical protein
VEEDMGDAFEEDKKQEETGNEWQELAHDEPGPTVEVPVMTIVERILAFTRRWR